MQKKSKFLNPVEVFMKSWRVYQDIIINNYMFHREISASVKQALSGFKPDQKINVLDLGCGDASMTLPLLSSERIASYVGCDLSKPALDIAESQLHLRKIPRKLLCDDMLQVMSEQTAESIDLIISSYALHHLATSQKHKMIQAIAQTLSPGGCFVLIDIFREPNEDRTAYIQHYTDQLKASWVGLSVDSQDLVIEHATEYDFPEQIEFYQTAFEKVKLNSGIQLAKHTWHQAWIFCRASPNSY